jgi:hypothetical protein
MRLMAYTPDAGLPPGLDHRTARQLLACVVKVAIADYRSGAEPRATEAAQWLDDAVGDPHWRDVAQASQQFQQARRR